MVVVLDLKGNILQTVLDMVNELIKGADNGIHNQLSIPI